ncbi:solute:sodium symporter family transporter [Anaeromyces robustus]|uniref:Solute:sodium symporter family transporter n=1 Tax=Anaeromyces robustus TaxID=1754192 RepID=A0A1Y1XIX8_9FUNG|nr:solute:sodium symporter family transporter [Anaeromyces robustus]|eukprot:ORX85711.1 solute:sodium symporter family transporter [Anaeromyces robustus]
MSSKLLPSFVGEVDLNRISLHYLDWIVIGIFALAMIWICLDVARKKKETSGDYFLSGRSATWISIGASIFASNIGSEHLIGLAGTGASAGMAQAHWEMQGWLILVLGWVFVPFYERSMVYTMPEFLERRFNRSCRTILTLISLCSYILTKVSVTVLAGGLALNTLLGINFWVAAFGLVIITAIYTVIGGMESVLKTSVLQTPILLLGSLVILIMSLNELGGWGKMMEICGGQKVNNYGDSMVNLMRSGKDENFPWYGALFGSAIIGFWYWCTDQYIVQRVLSGKNQKESIRGTIFGAYLKLTPVFFFLIPGMLAFALAASSNTDIGKSLAAALQLDPNAPDGKFVKNPDIAFPMLVNTLLPIGLKGVVICGILAALMSSLASLFNSSATLFTIDIYKRYRPNTEEKKLVVIGRIATVVIVVLGVLWIFVIRKMGDSLYSYLQSIHSLLSPSIASVFLLGVSWKKTSAKAGMWTLLYGIIVGAIRLVTMIVDPSSVNVFTYIFKFMNVYSFCVINFVSCIVLLIVITLFTEKPSEEQIKGICFGYATPEQKEETRRSWNAVDIINSVVIMIVHVIFYIYFW